MKNLVLISSIALMAAGCSSITGHTGVTSDTYYGDYGSASITGSTKDGYYCSVGADRYESGLTGYDREFVRCGKNWKIR